MPYSVAQRIQTSKVSLLGIEKTGQPKGPIMSIRIGQMSRLTREDVSSKLTKGRTLLHPWSQSELDQFQPGKKGSTIKQLPE